MMCSQSIPQGAKYKDTHNKNKNKNKNNNNNNKTENCADAGPLSPLPHSALPPSLLAPPRTNARNIHPLFGPQKTKYPRQ